MNSPTIILATNNPGKVRELAELLTGSGVDFTSLMAHRDAPPLQETENSYLGNARAKAMTVAVWSRSVALADDSGLEVDALQGRPGVHSARYAGTAQDSAANIEKLLAELKGVPLAQRTARFRCVIVVARPHGQVISVEATCEGVITLAPAGSDGFGYDPVFYYAPAQCTFAELSAALKNRVSHRARACEALRAQLLPFASAR